MSPTLIPSNQGISVTKLALCDEVVQSRIDRCVSIIRAKFQRFPTRIEHVHLLLGFLGVAVFETHTHTRTYSMIYVYHNNILYIDIVYIFIAKGFSCQFCTSYREELHLKKT